MDWLTKPRFLSRSEKVLLDRYFVFAQALETGNREPKTEKEKYFIKVCRGQAPPETAYQKVYLKYLKIKNHLQNMEKRQTVRDNKQIGKSDTKIKEKNMLEQHEETVLSQRRKENAEAALIMAERKKEREKGYLGTNIPEYEEGTPKPGWCTDEDLRKMKKQDYADMKSRQRE